MKTNAMVECPENVRYCGFAINGGSGKQCGDFHKTPMCSQYTPHDLLPSHPTPDMTQPLLGVRELTAMGIKVSNDGYVRTVRILPGKISEALIPPCILKNLKQYNEGGLSQKKQQTVRNNLRRYHLIPPPKLLRWEGLAPHLQRIQRRKYRHDWQLGKKRKTGIPLQNGNCSTPC